MAYCLWVLRGRRPFNQFNFLNLFRPHPFPAPLLNHFLHRRFRHRIQSPFLLPLPADPFTPIPYRIHAPLSARSRSLVRPFPTFALIDLSSAEDDSGDARPTLFTPRLSDRSPPQPPSITLATWRISALIRTACPPARHHVFHMPP